MTGLVPLQVTFSNITLNIGKKNHAVKSKTPFLFDCGTFVAGDVWMEQLAIRWQGEADRWQGVSKAHPDHQQPGPAFSLCTN